jgi:hypothetical protein
MPFDLGDHPVAVGTNLDYFDNLADHIAVLGIEDEVFEARRSQLRHPG